MLRDCLPLAAGAGFVVLLCGIPPAWAQSAPPLGSAATFAVLGATTVTNTGATTITGELGVSPGTAVTGFPPGVVVSGTIHANDGAAVAAQASAAGAYNSLVAETCTENLTGQDLGGKTLTAGVYCFGLAATLAGTLTLDAQGNPNAVFIFKMGTTITTGTGSSVVMINGGVPGNVFWQVGSSATVGVNASLVGNVLAFTSITMNGGATLIGRLIVKNAAITLDTNTVTVPASVTLSKAFTPTSLAIGGTTRLTFTLSNTSTSVQNGLAFTDTLPSGLVVAASPNVANSCTGTVNASGAVISLASGVAGASGACTIAVDVTNAPAATTPLSCPAPSLTNGASNISGLSLNLATASGFGACVDLVQSANLSISKTPPATLVAGQTVAYTLTVHNAGPSPAESVIVTDTLPAPLTFVSSTPSCTTSGQTVTCNLGTLTSGQTTPIALNVHVAPDVQAGTIISNTASVGSTTADPDPSNNTSSSLSPGVATSADLSTAKTALGASATPGATFTYRIVVTNNGPSTASNVSVTDPLPSPLTFISSPSGCTAAGQNVTCGTLAQIAPSASQTFDIIVALDPAYTGNGSDIGNVATASSPTPDPTPGNNASTPAAPPLVNAPSANLSLTKAAVEPNVSAGETFTYRIVVANAGPSTAANVSVTDTLPSQLAFVSSPQGCTATGQNVTCPNLATLALSADATFDLVVRLDPAYTGNGSDVANVAVVASATVDPDPGNNSNSPAPPPAIDPAKSDVQIVKSVSSAAVLPGQMFTYTLRATNNGPAVATNVMVTDTLPSQVTFTSSAAGCTAVGQNVTCPTSATLTVGADATFDIVVTLSPGYVGNGGDVLNSGFVTSTTTDPAPANNTSPGGAPPPVDPSQSDVAIVKSVSTTTAPPGGTFTYSLLVSNQGPSDATNVVVTDALATSVTFVSSTEGCTAAAQDVTCPTVATLIPGASQTFTFVARLDAGYTGNGSDLPNTGTVVTTTADPVPANNTSNTVFPPVGGAVADVSMAKTVLESSVTPGGTFTYHLTVSNAGPSTATDVAVTDVLPAPLAFVSSPQSCTVTGQNVTCPTVATLAAGATSTFDLVVRLDPSYTGNGSDIGNVANVNTTTTDPDPSNNPNAPPVGPPSVGPPSADLVTTKAAIESSVTPGGTFTYQILVTNNGPSTATIVQVTDPLPLALSFVSSPSGCAAPAQTVTCGPTASLLPGASATFAFVVRLSAAYTGNGSDLGNVASVTSFTPDPNTTNNSNAPAPPPTVGAPDADLSLTKVSVEANVTPGQTFTYQILVVNGGPSIATDVVLSDTLPGPLAYVSSSSLGCTAAGQVVTCPPLVSLAVGASTTVTLVVRLDPGYTGNGSDLGNIASVSSATNDPNPGDNANPPAPSPNVGPPQSDVQMVKSVSSATVLPGERHTYTLHVTNNGPSVATNVVVTDTLPPAVTFVSSPEGCTAAPGVGAHSITCPAIATLAVGAGTTFDLVVQLSPSYTGDGSDVLNGALVMSATADPATSNNSSQAGAPPVGTPAADLTVVKNVSAAPVTPGDTFTYTVMVSNQGPSDATNVVVTDPLPVGVIWVSSAEGCTAAGQNVTCPTFPTLAPGAWRTFTIVARLDQSYAGNGSDLENRATVTSATGDPVPGNNTSAPATPVVGTPSADLSTTKSVVDTRVLPGQTFTYRITIANAGPSTAHGVTVIDPLPSQTLFVYSPSGCTAVGQTVTCPPVSLTVGASATFDIVVQLSPAYTGDGSDIINTATVSAATNDPAPQNNSNPPAAPLVGTGEADLTITKTGPDGSVPTGGEITYTIVVTNQGPNAATDIVIQDPTPAGLTFLATEGACATAFPCALGTMLPGQAKTIAVRYAVPSTVTGVLTNTATISSATPDPSLANNAATAKTPPDPITYYLAEGATGTFWDEDVLIANPNAAPAPVTMRFLKESGEIITKTLVMAPMSRVTVRVDDQPGLEATSSSAEITSEGGLPLAVERTMTWDATAYGGHTETAVTQTATHWYFAEGAQGYFDVYLLLGNPNAVPVNVTLTFLREADTPVVKTLSIGAHARLTVHAGGIPELVNRSFGIVVDATQPVVAERSMYFGTTATRLWGGGHASAGVIEPSRRWFYAEGATGSFFDTFILLSNPQTITAAVRMEYILPSGEVITAAKLVPAQGRVTVSIDNEADARLHAAAVSTRITSDVPIVTERSMYWYTSPDVLPWSAGHNSFGVDQTAPRWGLAEGRVGGPHNVHTYILLANPWMATAEVTVTYVREAGAPLVKTYTVPPTTRYTIDVNSVVPELRNETFGAAIAVTNGLTISVERSLYWDANGVFWTAGTNAAATKLP